PSCSRQDWSTTTWSAASATPRLPSWPDRSTCRSTARRHRRAASFSLSILGGMSPLASVDVPASTANLGSGFDCFAAALSLKLRVELYEGSETGITLNAHGEGVPNADADPDQNLIIRAFREGMRAAMGAPMGSGAWRLEVSSMIPAARGLGSSAAAIMGGLL